MTDTATFKDIPELFEVCSHPSSADEDASVYQ
jgi:hypothetical protein